MSLYQLISNFHNLLAELSGIIEENFVIRTTYRCKRFLISDLLRSWKRIICQQGDAGACLPEL